MRSSYEARSGLISYSGRGGGAFPSPAFLSKYRQYAALVLAALLVGIDQLTKWLVVSNMEMYNVVPLIKIDGVEVLNLFYCTNNGSAFSMMEGKTAFLIGITSLVIVALIVGLVTKRIQRGTYVTAVALIIGGGTGNLIDRLFNNGSVVDFIDVRIINFPIFNFADICAVVGGVLLCLAVVIDEIRENRAKKARKSQQAESAQTEEPKSNGND